MFPCGPSAGEDEIPPPAANENLSLPSCPTAWRFRSFDPR
jgi:hypothetical protein